MKHIIIVEDDSSVLEPMTIILRNAGYLVTGFFDGSLILANEYTLPDLFIIDKQLHGVDGLDICRHLKSQEVTKNIPVIMVSANPSIIDFARDAMADDAIEKPFRMKELRDIVARHLKW